MHIIFWTFLVLIIYTYVGYPLVLRMLNRWVKPRTVDKGAELELPLMSVVIPAYNEEAAIAQKIRNVLSADYPRDKLEVVIASDCSSDQTDTIVRSFADQGVRLSRLAVRGGKIAGYRNALAQLAGEIVIFSDATSHLEAGSFKALARNFQDPTVGCVGARLQYDVPQADHVGKGEHTYWSYESRIKLWESNLHSLTSVSGTFYAVRRELYPLDMPLGLADDLVVPLSVVRGGRRVVLEPEAVCREETVVNDTQEFRKRCRITVQNIGGLWANRDLLNVLRYGRYAWMLLSHKMLRLVSPFLLIGLLGVSLILAAGGSGWFMLLVLGQIAFYAVGVASHFTHIKNPKVVNSVHYFCLSNYAILAGWIKFFQGYQAATWER